MYNIIEVSRKFKRNKNLEWLISTRKGALSINVSTKMMADDVGGAAAVRIRISFLYIYAFNFVD